MNAHKPTNRFGGWCHSCHCWVAIDAGFLDGRDERRNKWRLICAGCQVASAGTSGEDAGRTRQAEPDQSGSKEKAKRRAQERARRDRQNEEFRRLVEEMTRAWQGYSGVPECFRVLGLTPPVTADVVNRRFRSLAMEAHPDHGGEATRFVGLKKARDEALALVGS